MKTILIPLMLLCSLNIMAQDSTKKKNVDDFFSMADTMQIPDSVKSKFVLSPEDSSALKMRQDIFQYTFNQNRKVFQWQYISSIIIFFIVVLIVLMGLYMAYMQFRLSEKMFLKQSADKTKDDANALEMIKSDLEFGKDGLKINTAVIGLMILSLSLAFLFLYLKYVYPISIVKIT
jgi:hypothetical protein